MLGHAQSDVDNISHNAKAFRVLGEPPAVVLADGSVAPAPHSTTTMLMTRSKSKPKLDTVDASGPDGAAQPRAATATAVRADPCRPLIPTDEELQLRRSSLRRSPTNAETQAQSSLNDAGEAEAAESPVVQYSPKRPMLPDGTYAPPIAPSVSAAGVTSTSTSTRVMLRAREKKSVTHPITSSHWQTAPGGVSDRSFIASSLLGRTAKRTSSAKLLMKPPHVRPGVSVAVEEVSQHVNAALQRLAVGDAALQAPVTARTRSKLQRLCVQLCLCVYVYVCVCVCVCVCVRLLFFFVVLLQHFRPTCLARRADLATRSW
jgi:hypothetical protein